VCEQQKGKRMQICGSSERARSIVRHPYKAHLKTLGLGPASSQKRAGHKATSVARVYPATRRTGQGTALGRAQGHQRRARLPCHAPHGSGDGAWPGTRPPASRASTLPRAARVRGRRLAGHKATSVARVYPATRRTGQGTESTHKNGTQAHDGSTRHGADIPPLPHVVAACSGLLSL